MSLVNSSFAINVTPGAMPPTVHVSEYDIGRTYTVTINGENGSAFNIPSGTTATVEGTLNGVIGFTTDATISGSTVSFTLTESMTAASGKAWCKIKLTLNDEPIQTCAFVLAVDRAGVEADTIIGASGFEQQIVNAVNDWLDEHPPASGGLTDDVKTALLDCFENVAWVNDDGHDYYDALYAALYPPAEVLSISAVFTQGEAVIYDTDSLDKLKQYLVVTATMTDSTTQTVTNYTLSGTLTEGVSTINVLYGGKNATFSVTVTHRNTYDDPDGWILNKSLYLSSSYYGTAFEDLIADLNARMISKDLIPLESNQEYVFACASDYSIRIAMFDDDGKYRAVVGTVDSKTVNVSTDQYKYICVIVTTPSTATAADVTASNVSAYGEADKYTGTLTFKLNTAIYSTRVGENFDAIQATVDKRMLSSLIPIRTGTAYRFQCNAPYEMYGLLIDSNNIYQGKVGDSYFDDGGSSFFDIPSTNTYGFLSLTVKTAETATSADASAFTLYELEN